MQGYSRHPDGWPTIVSNSAATYFDLAFGIRATKPIPVDHGYALYGAISRLVPEAHAENGIAVHPIRGQQIGERLLSLRLWSSPTIRVPDGGHQSLEH